MKLLVVFLIVAVFLVWFAAVSMQIFGYLDTETPCNRFGIDQFGDFFKVKIINCHYLYLPAFFCTSGGFNFKWCSCFAGFRVNVSVDHARGVDGAHGRDYVSS